MRSRLIEWFREQDFGPLAILAFVTLVALCCGFAVIIVLAVVTAAQVHGLWTLCFPIGFAVLARFIVSCWRQAQTDEHPR